MQKVAVTGGICTGKSSLCQLLSLHGYPVISADALAKECLKPTSSVYSDILQLFSVPKSELSATSIAQIIFNDAHLRQKLEQITHPFIEQRLLAEEERIISQNTQVIFYEIPLLFEKNLDSRFDYIILVTCDLDQQQERLMAREQITNNEALKRINSQLPQTEKIHQSHLIIHNSQSLEKLKEFIEVIKEELCLK